MGSCASDCLEGFSPVFFRLPLWPAAERAQPHPQHRLASARLVSTENNLKPALNRAVDPACTVFAAALLDPAPQEVVDRALRSSAL